MKRGSSVKLTRWSKDRVYWLQASGTTSLKLARCSDGIDYVSAVLTTSGKLKWCIPVATSAIACANFRWCSNDSDYKSYNVCKTDVALWPWDFGLSTMKVFFFFVQSCVSVRARRNTSHRITSEVLLIVPETHHFMSEESLKNECGWINLEGWN